MANKRLDEPTGTETVGHEWDGIEELDTPMPRWWVNCFYLTIIFALGYAIAYPAWPMLTKATDGLLGWSSRGELAKDIAHNRKAQEAIAKQFASLDITDIANNPKLMEQARAGGAAAFKVNCVQCHGAGAGGNHELGYPNLNDDDWLWGGDLKAIEYTITHGIRQKTGNEQRQSQMPSFEGGLDEATLAAVITHVRSLSGLEKPNAVGAEAFANNCAACHGVKGEGNRTLGAPNLGDAIWLRGSSQEAIRAQILKPKMGAMPAWGKRLDPLTVKMLAIYVHSLGGGEKMAEVPAGAPIAAAPVAK